MAVTQSMSPPIPEPKRVSAAVDKIRAYMNKAGEFNSLAETFQKNTGADLSFVNDPRDVVSQKMIADAKARTKKGKEGAIKVIGDPSNTNTCLAGVCTIASDAGVSFDKLKGNVLTGLATDEKGRKIPQYNPLFTSQLDKTGYYELTPDDKPMPGDLVQYFEPQGNMGELKPYHMEFITDDKGNNEYATFNNWGLYNEGKGESGVVDARKTGYADSGRASKLNRFYRLKPETAKAAVGEDNIKMIEQARSMKQELAGLRSAGLDGESQDVFNIIALGAMKGQPKEKVLKNAMALSKDKEFVRAVADELYK